MNSASWLVRRCTTARERKTKWEQELTFLLDVQSNYTLLKCAACCLLMLWTLANCWSISGITHSRLCSSMKITHVHLCSFWNLYFWRCTDACNHLALTFLLTRSRGLPLPSPGDLAPQPGFHFNPAEWWRQSARRWFLNCLTFLKWRQQEFLKSENHLVLSCHWTNSFYVWRPGAMPWWESHWKQKVTSAIYRIYYTSLRNSVFTVWWGQNQWNVCPSCSTWQKTGLEKEIWHH